MEYEKYDSLTHSLSDNLKLRDASASKNNVKIGTKSFESNLFGHNLLLTGSIKACLWR